MRVVSPGAAGTTLTVDPPLVGLFTLRARLTRTDTGAPISGKTVVMSTSASTLCQAVTDADGVASCGGPQSAIPVLLDSGYDAAFAGDSEFLASSARATLLTGGRESSATPPPATPTNARPAAGAAAAIEVPSRSQEQLPATGGVPGMREGGLVLLVLGAGAALGRRALRSSPRR